MIALPPQPVGVPWPTRSWPEAAVSPAADARALGRVVDALMRQSEVDRFGVTRALLVVHRGCLVVERYRDGVLAEATQPSWSMAKSVLHALVGQLAEDDLIELDAAAPVPSWRSEGDPRGAIAFDNLLRMVDGLDFVEYDPAAGRADVIEMLRDARNADTAAFAEGRPLAHAPGTVFNYSSGTSMIVAAIARRALGGGRAAMETYMQERLLGPLGMSSARPRFDGVGTFLGSSYFFATPRDFARFGLLYLRDGVWEERRVLPSGWVDHARRATGPSRGVFGAHWWLDVGAPGTFSAKGYQGQYTIVAPDRDLVVVRLGASTEPQREHVVAALGDVIRSFPLLCAQTV